MRRFVLALTVLAIAGVSAPAADAARVTSLRVTGAPSWEQWIERGTVTQGHLGLYSQTACSPREPRITYNLVRTSEPASSTGPVLVNYTGILWPLTLGKQLGGGSQQHVLSFGPVSHPLHVAFYGQSSRDPDFTSINGIGRWVLAVAVDVRQPTDLLVNWRSVNYRGVVKPAGACVAAGLDTYNVRAIEPPPAA